MVVGVAVIVVDVVVVVVVVVVAYSSVKLGLNFFAQFLYN